jgi:N-acetylmuramoyl-L-alanine amidase
MRFCGGRALLFAALLFTTANARAADPAPDVTAVHITEANGLTRLTLDLSSGVAATARPVADPDRILVDLPELTLSPEVAAKAQPAAGGLVSDFRIGSLGPGKSRLVVELGRKACVSSLTQEGGAAAHLVLSLSPCDPKQFASAVQAAPTASHAAAATELPVIVIDPGHGGIDAGAHGVKGAVEKTIVFEFANQLKTQLAESHRYKVVMTRDSDEYVSLEDRVQIARDANAALMISIHADTFPTRSTAQADDIFGTTVYTCSDRASDAEAARIAARENAADRAGSAKSSDGSGVADILFDLKRRETRAYAHLFARGLVSELKGAGRLNRHPERSAGFFVLKAPDYPSVLVELGYLSNPEDVANMTDAVWRQRSVAAVAAAIDRFFAANPAGESTSPSQTLATTDHGGDGQR